MADPLIAILTDFGLADPFVGILKGVIATIAPGVQTIDLSHEVPPGDIQRAAMILWQSIKYFPDGTIFLCVVDPGVGTARRPIIIKANIVSLSKQYMFVGPDNGLFTYVLGKSYIGEVSFEAWEISNLRLRMPDPSTTFHGRDIFAPAAAHAALSVPGSEFGPGIKDLVQLPSPRLQAKGEDTLEGEVLYADRFGNLITSLGNFTKAGSGVLEFKPWISSAFIDGFPTRFPAQFARLHLPGEVSLPFVQTFEEAPPNSCAVLAGSTGLLEIIANRKSAYELLRLEKGAITRLALIYPH